MTKEIDKYFELHFNTYVDEWKMNVLKEEVALPSYFLS